MQAMAGREIAVSGGGTGTSSIDAEEGVFTELQAGSYVFLDTDYGAVELGRSGEEAFEVALFLRATVTSVNQPGFVSIDAGTKAFALNGPPPRCTRDPWRHAGFRFMGDEHAHLLLDPGVAKPRLGEPLEFVVSHCDPTVHHFDHFYVVRDEDVVDVWKIAARGRR
jgi:D-serine deaminase-like pyridoxal phosphate-dependent protein